MHTVEESNEALDNHYCLVHELTSTMIVRIDGKLFGFVPITSQIIILDDDSTITNNQEYWWIADETETYNLIMQLLMTI
jgi:hypothetical protein